MTKGPFLDLPDIGPGCSSFADEMAKIRAEVNGIETELGSRPYRVYSVRLLWSGGQVGHGEIRRTLIREYLPRPKVDFRTRREFTPMGFVERGGVTLSEISAQLSPRQVTDLFADDHPLEPGEEAFIEIALDARYGEEAERRRFVPDAPPERRPYDWRLTLKQQAGQRAPDGTSTAQGARRPF